MSEPNLSYADLTAPPEGAPGKVIRNCADDKQIETPHSRDFLRDGFKLGDSPRMRERPLATGVSGPPGERIRV